MNDGFLIITNNTLVKEKLGENYHVEYEDLSYEAYLARMMAAGKRIRNLIEQE